MTIDHRTHEGIHIFEYYFNSRPHRTTSIYTVISCCRLPEVYGLLPGDQLGLGLVHRTIHVSGPRRDERQPVGGRQGAEPVLVSRTPNTKILLL